MLLGRTEADLRAALLKHFNAKSWSRVTPLSPAASPAPLILPGRLWRSIAHALLRKCHRVAEGLLLQILDSRPGPVRGNAPDRLQKRFGISHHDHLVYFKGKLHSKTWAAGNAAAQQVNLYRSGVLENNAVHSSCTGVAVRDSEVDCEVSFAGERYQYLTRRAGSEEVHRPPESAPCEGQWTGARAGARIQQQWVLTDLDNLGPTHQGAKLRAGNSDRYSPSRSRWHHRNSRERYRTGSCRRICGYCPCYYFNNIVNRRRSGGGVTNGERGGRAGEVAKRSSRRTGGDCPYYQERRSGAATGKDLADLNRGRLDDPGLEIESRRRQRRSSGHQEYRRRDGSLL
jgi:hypothetical protein